MFTKIDKAIAAVLSGAFFVAAKLFGWDLDLDPAVFDSLAVAITTFLVWLIPNAES